MKRKTAFFTVILLLVCALTACSSPEKTQPTATPGAAQTTAEAATAVPTTQEPTAAPATEKPQKDVIVVLDPGHDAEKCPRDHPQLGVSEHILNLKIGLACYERLNAYEGVQVYMTRMDGTCPDIGDKYGDCIPARTAFATEKHADLFVSLHCNAVSGELGEEANGACVYISQYPPYKKLCTPLAELILQHITQSVDVASDGVHTRENPEKGTYPDGTVKDYYYLISNNVDDGRPGIIVEHAFMDNIHDNAVLRDDKNLELFGQADADAIAAFYGLHLKEKTR